MKKSGVKFGFFLFLKPNAAYDLWIYCGNPLNLVSRFHEILIWKFWTWKVKTKWRWSFDAIFHFVFQLRNLLIEFTIFKSLGLLSPSYVRISITSKTRKIQKSRKEKKFCQFKNLIQVFSKIVICLKIIDGILSHSSSGIFKVKYNGHGHK